MNFGQPTEKNEAFRMVDVAIDAGINLIDCADIYSSGESKRILGEAFKRNKKRSRVLITSKVFNRMGPEPNDLGLSKYHNRDGCDKSLQRLQMDHIDIFFYRPDFSVPVEETLEALDILVKQGRVKIHCLFDLSRLENHRSHVVNYFNTAEWMK